MAQDIAATIRSFRIWVTRINGSSGMAVKSAWFMNSAALTSAWVIAALFLPLVFQDIRLEGYETEKAGVLWMLGAPLVTALPALLRRRIGTQPLTWIVLALIAVASISALASVSPHTSLFGLIGRGQGILTYLAYGALFLGAALVGWRVRRALIPALIAVSVPLCLYALYQRFDVGNPRPGSLLGNANFLASWLILALILLIAHFLTDPHPRIRALGAAVIALNAATLYLTQSRGALAGLAVGMLTVGLAWCALTGRRRFALGLIAASAAGVVIYLAAGALIPEMEQGGALRFLRPIDVFRLDAWNAGWRLIAGLDAPLLDAFGRADSLSALRPWIGYGLDTTPFLQSSFGIVGSLAYFIDTFHTLTLDALTWTGIVGLLLWTLVYLAGIATALRSLGLIRLTQFCAIHLIGVVVGALGMALFLRARVLDPAVLALIGAMLGLPLGTVVYLMWRVARSQLPRAVDPMRVAIVGVIAAHWVDLQFGFGTVAADSLWWICLGIAVSRGKRFKLQEVVRWQAVLSAGVILIAGIGLTTDSQYVRHEVGTAALPYLLGALIMIGLVSRRLLPGIVLCGIVWAVWFFIEWLIGSIIGREIDARLTDSAASFRDGVGLLAFKSILMTMIIVGIWSISRGFRWVTVVALIVGFVLGAAFYRMTFQDSVQLAIANRYADLPDLNARSLALRLYDELDRPDAVFAALQARARWFGELLDSRQIDALLYNEPYLTGRRDWALFYDSYVERFRQPPTYAVDVIRDSAFVGGFARWRAWADADVRETNGRARFIDTGQNPEARGAIYQRTGIQTSAGTRFNAEVQLMNPSAQSQTVLVFVHAADWSEARACPFTLMPGETLGAVMMAYSERAWDDTQISIYLDEGGEIIVNRVSLRLTPPDGAELPQSVRRCEPESTSE